MTKLISRRDILMGAAGAGACASAQNTPVQLGARTVDITITPVTRVTARITVQPLDNGTRVPVRSTGALVEKGWGSPIAIHSLTIPRVVNCGDLTVKVSNNPLVVRVEDKSGGLIQELKIDAVTGSVSFPMGEGRVLGLGQGGPQFDRRGQLDKMGSRQRGYKLATHGAKVPIQLAIGTSGWAMFIHQPVGAFDLTGKDGVFQPAQQDALLPLDVFVIGAKEPAAVPGEYARITGYPEMAPLWSFGYQQSHRTLGPPEEILQEAKKFRERKLPCDAMIYLGTGFCPNGWNTNNGEFVWNSKAFPDPRNAIQSLHDDNFKVVLHIVI